MRPGQGRLPSWIEALGVHDSDSIQHIEILDSVAGISQASILAKTKALLQAAHLHSKVLT